jgi:hypothetical protein
MNVEIIHLNASCILNINNNRRTETDKAPRPSKNSAPDTIQQHQQRAQLFNEQVIFHLEHEKL